jgi:hypothetical protein
VLRMLSAVVGEEKFLKGVSIYLKKLLYGHSVTEDLWIGILPSSCLLCISQNRWYPSQSKLSTRGSLSSSGWTLAIAISAKRKGSGSTFQRVVCRFLLDALATSTLQAASSRSFR